MDFLHWRYLDNDLGRVFFLHFILFFLLILSNQLVNLPKQGFLLKNKPIQFFDSFLFKLK